MPGSSVLLIVIAFLLINGICTGYYVQPEIIQFTSHPQSQVIIENSTATFQCSINKTSLDNSLPNVTIIWINSNDNNSTDICSKIVNYDDSSVITSECVIESVQLMHEGSYQCHVIDGMNESLCVNLPCIKTVTASMSAYLKVISSNPAVQTSSLRLSSSSSSNITSTILHCIMPANHIYRNDFNVIWKRDEQYIITNETFRILASNNLLLLTNTSNSIQSLIGLYECQLNTTSNTTYIVSRIDVLPPLLNDQSSGTNISLVFSSFHTHRDLIILPSIHTTVEFACLFNNVITTPHIIWTHNNVIMNGSNSVWLEMNEQLPGNYCCSFGELTSCSNIHITSPEVSYSSTLYPDVNTTVLHLDCNSSHNIHWLYNGYSINTPHTASIALTSNGGNWSQYYGIYQCIKFNTTTIALYRILPSGWTNPVTNFQLITNLPPVNFSIKVQPPLFIGSILSTSLMIRVNTMIRLTPFTEPLINDQTLYGPHFLSSSYTNSADYIFSITMVNSLEDNISETITSSIFTPCMVYVPVAPIVSLTCGQQVSVLKWTQSSLDPYQMYTEKHLTVECFNDYSQRVYTNHTIWSTVVKNDTIIINRDIGINGSCNYTIQGVWTFPLTCAGIAISGMCNTSSTDDTLISSTQALKSSTDILSPLSSFYSQTDYTTIIKSSTLIYHSSISPSFIISPTLNMTDPLSITDTDFIIASVSNELETVMELPANNGYIIIIAILLGVLLLLLALFLLLFMPIIIWRQKRIKKQYNVTYPGVYQEYYNSPTILLDDGDTQSIKTCYGELNFSNTVNDDNRQQQEEDFIVIEDVSAFSNTIPYYTAETMTSDFLQQDSGGTNALSSSDDSHINDNHMIVWGRGRERQDCSSATSGNTSSEYLDINHLTVDSSSSSSSASNSATSTRVELNVSNSVELTAPVVVETDHQLPSDSYEQCHISCPSEVNDNKCQFVSLQDNNDSFHGYETMVEMVQL